jgi:hypothetical protein
MSDNKASLWWAYDAEGGKFSALPASPLLLPALLFMGLFSIGKAIFSPTLTTGQGLGPVTKTDYYQRQYNRWRELGHRAYTKNELLQWHEWEEYYSIKRYLDNPYGHKQ